MKSFKEFLTEGVNDPARHKAIFVVGGPGSGKSYVSSRTTHGLGFKHINSDDLFELGMKKHGLETTPENIYSQHGQVIRDHAKDLTARRQHHYVQGRLGLVIDGTGKDPDKIKKQSEHLKKHGYDTHMIFVKTTLETAKERNLKRSRVLPTKELEDMHHQVNSHIETYKKHFGHDNFNVVDNNNPTEHYLLQAHKHVRKIAAAPVKNPLAK